MTPIRLAGSVVSLVTGLLGAAIELIGGGPSQTSPTELHGALTALGAGLAVVSVISFVGLRAAFFLAAALSAAVLATLALSWGDYAASEADALAVLSAVALVVDTVAARQSKELSEKDSPLNLPVFG